MNKNDIVSVVTVAGEFVGKFVSDVDGVIELDDPRMIVQGPEGQMGFAHGVCSSLVSSETDCCACATAIP